MNPNIPDLGKEVLLTEGKLPETIEELQSTVKNLKQDQADMMDLLKRMKIVIGKNPRARYQLVEHLGGSIGTIKRHGYYTEKAANFIKPYVDKMLANNYEPICFTYEDYKDTFSTTSLKQFLHAGLRYLVDNMDDESLKYEKFKKNTLLRNKSVGIYIMKRTDNELEIEPRQASQVVEASDWKETLNTYLTTSEPGERYTMENLLLSSDDQNYIHAILDGNEEYLFTVTVDTIKVIHLRPEDR